MSHWTICFDAVITAEVEADTAKQAVQAAEKTLDEIGIDRLNMGESANCSIGRIYVTQIDKPGAKVRRTTRR